MAQTNEDNQTPSAIDQARNKEAAQKKEIDCDHYIFLENFLSRYKTY